MQEKSQGNSLSIWFQKGRLLHSLLKPNSDPLMSMNPIIDLIVSNLRVQACGYIS